MVDHQSPIPDTRTHFLVSGGGKGITARCVIALAEQFGSTFTLLGRSALLDQDPDWAAGLEAGGDLNKAALNHLQEHNLPAKPRDLDQMVRHVLSSREINHTLAEIRRAGGKARYLQADVTSIEELQETLADTKSDINAVLHGAGALADRRIEDKTAADFDLVYGVKIGGLLNILELIPPEQLQFLVLFSSVAGFYGNPGQADYSLSNEILNKAAHAIHSRHPDCQVLSIGWGPWDGGMVSPQLKRILTRKGIPLIGQDEGAQTLVEMLSNPEPAPQHLVGDPLPFPSQKLDRPLRTYRVRRQLTLEVNPFLADHVIGGNPVLPTVCAVAWLIRTSLDLHPGFTYHAVRDYRALKGIVFDGSQARDYILELRETSLSSELITLEGKIHSLSDKGKIRYHYQAEVELRRNLPEPPAVEGIAIPAGIKIPGRTLYEERVLFHGSRFQGLQDVLQMDQTGLISRCQLDKFPASEMGQFPADEFNPYLADAHLQSMLVWSYHQQGAVGLPLSIMEGIQYRRVPFGTPTYALLKVNQATPHKLNADVISFDDKGLVYTAVHQAEITLNRGLMDLFRENQLEKAGA